MKIMIASDIHGSDYWCGRLLDAFRRENASRLLLLGDILYHGPRNDLPRDYSPKDVAKRLNDVKDSVLCVRGNCDTEVDQMVLDFPIMADYCVLYLCGLTVYATHGHHFNGDTPPPLRPGEILLCGHTHVPQRRDCGYFTLMNPGSVAIPKDGSDNSYMTFSDGLFEWKTLSSTAPRAFTPGT